MGKDCADAHHGCWWEVSDYCVHLSKRRLRADCDHEDQPPSLPDAAPRSDRPRCGGRESNFLAEKRND